MYQVQKNAPVVQQECHYKDFWWWYSQSLPVTGQQCSGQKELLSSTPMSPITM